MVTIQIYNARTQIVGAFHKEKVHCDAYHNALRAECSYFVPGSEWSPAYKSGQWDGLISLYEKRSQSFPTGLLPRVLAALKLQGCEYRLVEMRVKPEKNLNATTRFADYNRSLYPYQKNAVERAVKAGRGILAISTGGGKTMTTCQIIAELGVGPVIFSVPSLSLLTQTHREFSKYLSVDGKPAEIGIIGDGVCKIVPEGINVCTYQTALAAFNEKFNENQHKVVQDECAGEGSKKTLVQLQEEYARGESALEAAKSIAVRNQSSLRAELSAMRKSMKTNPPATEKDRAQRQKAIDAFLSKLDKAVAVAVRAKNTVFQKAKAALEARLQSLDNKKQIRRLFKRARVIIMDEAHIAAIVLETLCGHAENAYYRLGLSATPWREDNQEIRVEGCVGRKIVQVTASYLIENHFLVPPRIYMVAINHIEDGDNYADLYSKHITHCWERNIRIKQFAEAFKEAGKPVMIICDLIEHGALLETMIQDSVFVPGGDKGEDDPDDEERDYRRRMLNACERNEIIIIGTKWMNTGIDAPAVSTLIMAGSTQASATTLQTIGRVLRLHPESGKEEAVVIDFMDNEKSMHKHSIARKRVYQSEEAFILKMIA